MFILHIVELSIRYHCLHSFIFFFYIIFFSLPSNYCNDELPFFVCECMCVWLDRTNDQWKPTFRFSFIFYFFAHQIFFCRLQTKWTNGILFQSEPNLNCIEIHNKKNNTTNTAVNLLSLHPIVALDSWSLIKSKQMTSYFFCHIFLLSRFVGTSEHGRKCRSKSKKKISVL